MSRPAYVDPDSGEAMVTVFSAAMYRAGLCPGLSSYDSESPIAEAIRRATEPLRIGRLPALPTPPTTRVRRERW